MTWSFRNPQPSLILAAALALSPLLPGGSRPVNQASAQAPAAGGRPVKPTNAAAAALPPRGAASGSASLPAPRPGWSYPQRQTLTYQVDWRVFPAGTAVVHIESNGDSQRITVSGDSSGAFNLVLRVNDHFQSTFNRQTGCSSGFARQQIEGSRQLNSDQQFSNGFSRSAFDEKTLITRNHHAEQTPIPPCVSDPLSAIFWAASQPLQPGQQFHVPVVYPLQALDVTAKVEGREAVRAPATTYQALRIQPTWPGTTVKNSGNIWVWYSEDDRHLPVQVRARLLWGTVTFRLTGVEQK